MHVVKRWNVLHSSRIPHGLLFLEVAPVLASSFAGSQDPLEKRRFATDGSQGRTILSKEEPGMKGDGEEDFLLALKSEKQESNPTRHSPTISKSLAGSTG